VCDASGCFCCLYVLITALSAPVGISVALVAIIIANYDNYSSRLALSVLLAPACFLLTNKSVRQASDCQTEVPVAVTTVWLVKF